MNDVIDKAVSLLTTAGYRTSVATMYPSRDVAIIVEGIPLDDKSGYNRADIPTQEKEKDK